MNSRPLAATLGFAVLAVLIVHAMHQCGKALRPPGSVVLDARDATFMVYRDGHIRIRPKDGGRDIDAEIVTVDDDGVRPAPAASLDVDAANDALVIGFGSDAGEDSIGGVRLSLEGRDVFLSGRGDVGDLASDAGPMVVVEDVLHPVAVVGAGEALNVDVEPALPPRSKQMSLRVTTNTNKLTLIAGHGSAVWAALFASAKTETERVKGRVTGATGTARIIGLDDEGAPRMRVTTDAAGRFDFPAPKTVTSFYASVSATRTSAPVPYAPGTPWDLKLDVSDGGELEVKAVDPDTHEPITARLIVHGIDGTLDPSFGPDYRASGAGPIIDALRGAVTTPLPTGRYRVAATKGIAWSIDSKTVDIVSGKRTSIELYPRHVVPTPGERACDFHVHARPSFDAPVSPEDRVLSLVAAGIDFAVPSEHNLVGDYGPAIQVEGVGSELSFVPGVEVTTYMPKFGHFGVFPYPTDKPPPFFKATDQNKVFASARAGDPSRMLVVNHPRLTREIGYFTALGWKAGGPIPLGMRKDFDAVEVFNGYESASLERVETVLGDYYALLDTGRHYAATGSSDSHRIQYQWAGYPRTMVRVGDDHEPLAVVAAIKAAHATITDGPIIELEIEHARPGDEIEATHPLVGRLVVRAAPWVDVTSATLVEAGNVVQTFEVPSRPLSTGPEEGSLDEAVARTVRLDVEVRLGAPDHPTWVLATARGERRLDDILPFMPLQPFAMTNPIWLKPTHM